MIDAGPDLTDSETAKSVSSSAAVLAMMPTQPRTEGEHFFDFNGGRRVSVFTQPMNEFATPSRVINYHICNSYWNDVRVMFDYKDFPWRPRNTGTPRQFECTRLITAEAVKAATGRISEFGNTRAVIEAKSVKPAAGV